MGLISKIEDKLSSSNKHEEPNKLEKPNRKSYEEGGNSRLQNPVSSQEKYGTGSHGRTGAGGVDRDGYGSQPAGYNSSSGGTHGSQGYGQPTSERYDESTGGDKYSSGGPRQPFDPYSSKGQRTAANVATGREGHSHGHGHGHGNEAGYGSSERAQGYGDSSTSNSDVARSRHGGVMNSSENPQYSSSRRNEDAIPTAGGQKLGESGSAYDSGAYTGSGHQSGHHYGRDAAMAGGAGAAGMGAYEANKMHNHGHESESRQHASYDPMQSSTGGQNYADPTTAARMGHSGGAGGYGHGQPGSTGSSDVSYMRNAGERPTEQYDTQGRSSYDSPGAGMTSGTGPTGMSGNDSHTSSGIGGGSSGSSGLPMGKKMGGAYERGYEDAMEHMKAEMQGKNL